MFLIGQIREENMREKLERIVGADDSTFSGLDLATLIRKKYGKSYDIQLIKKVRSHTTFRSCQVSLLPGTCYRTFHRYRWPLHLIYI